VNRVTNIIDCTVPEKILVAAHQLEEQGQSPFSAEALIVAAWQRFPRTFGLKGYSDQYPDSNKVLSSIMGVKGLARRGWLAKMGQKLYALTREGRQVVRRLLQDGEAPETEPTFKLSREQDKFLLSLFATTAVEKFEEDRKQELTFGDACRFWSITENLHGEALDNRLNGFRGQLADLERQVGMASAELSNGRHVSADEINQLMTVHEYLQERFSRHLTLLRNRAGRN
jgi:hypothetical protein